MNLRNEIKNLGPEFRTPLVLSALLIVSLLIGIVTFISSRAVSKQKEDFAKDVSQRLIEIEKMRTFAEKKIAHSRGYFITGDPELLSRTDEARAELLKSLNIVQQRVTTEQGKLFVQETQVKEGEHHQSILEIIEKKKSNVPFGQLSRDFETKLHPKRLALEKALDDFADYEHKLTEQAAAEAAATTKAIEIILALVGLLSFLGILTLSYLLIRTIQRLLQARKAIQSAHERENLAQIRFEDLVNHLDHSVVWEARGEPFSFNFVSERILFLLGLPARPFLEHSEMFFDYINPDDREKVRATFKKALKTRTDQRCDHRMKTVDGHEIWVQSGVHIKPQADGTIHLYGLTVDISHLKKSEQTLQRALQDLKDFKHALDVSSIVAITDNKGVITYVNDKFCEVSKYSRQELIGKTHKIINSNYHPPEFFKGLWETIQSGRVWRGDIMNRAKDGSYYWVQTFIVPFLDEKGTPYQYVAIRSDITDRVRAENERSDLIQKLTEEQEVKNKFVNMLTHDLRTPLAAAKMGVNLISQQPTDPEFVIGLTQRVLSSIGRIDKMVEDLLDAHRIQAGKPLHAQPGRCNLNELVHQVVDELTLVHGKRFIVNESGRVEAYWTGEGIQRVLENLANNAVKYGRPDTPITMTLQEKEGWGILSVHNYGEPINSREIQTLFEPFQRASTATSSGKSGWGIGLTLVRGITEAHGGKVEVKSDITGTTFTIRFPLKALNIQRPQELTQT